MTTSPTRQFKNAAWAHLAEVGKALSSAARLEILELLAQAPRTVDVLAGEIGQSVANTSHHLQALHRARVVRRERKGLHVEYALAGPEIGSLLALLQDVAARHVLEIESLRTSFFAERDGLEALDREALLARLRDNTVILIDVRPESEFAAGHLPGARSLPLDLLEARLDELPRDRPIVAYCRGPYCTWSADAARRLRELGFDARRADVSVHSALEGALQ